MTFLQKSYNTTPRMLSVPAVNQDISGGGRMTTGDAKGWEQEKRLHAIPLRTAKPFIAPHTLLGKKADSDLLRTASLA